MYNCFREKNRRRWSERKWATDEIAYWGGVELSDGFEEEESSRVFRSQLLNSCTKVGGGVARGKGKSPETETETHAINGGGK